MADRPILFSAPMVRALLAGTKTQTRRVAPIASTTSSVDWRKTPYPGFYRTDQFGDLDFVPVRIPIKVGDRLWVKENFAIVPRSAYARSEGVQQTLRPDDDHDAAVYAADWERSKPSRWRPSIHMFRWASRLTLHVTEVRVQRLQDISEADALAEGCVMSAPVEDIPPGPDPRASYFRLWDTINGEGAAEKNPWVAAYTFTVEKSNIDGAA